MKLGKRTLIAIGVSGLLVAGAVAIPIGIVFGTKPTKVQDLTPINIDRSGDLTRNIPFPWGTDPKTTVPTVDYAVDPADGYKGEFTSSTLTDATPVGSSGVAKIVYTYKPASVNKPYIFITYGLDVSKGTPRDLATLPAPTNPARKPVSYGTLGLPAESGFEALAKANGYVASLTDPVVYRKADGSPLLAAELATLAIGQTFTAVHTADLDTVHYNASVTNADATVTTFPAKSMYTYTYEVVAAPAVEPTAFAKTLATADLPFGTFSGTTAPANPKGPYAGYVLQDAKAVITKASSRPVAANHLSPALGTDVVWAQVGQYNVGTEFAVTYTYDPDANHTGKRFTAVGTYRITALTATAPTATTLTVANVNYGTTAAANGNVPLPTSSTPLPTSASLGGTGYDNGTYGKIVVTATNTATTTADRSNSPAVGTELTWAQVATLNAGVTFQVELVYKLLEVAASPAFSDYVGEASVTLKRTYAVVPQVGAADVDDNDFHVGDYVQGTDPTPLLEGLSTSANAVSRYDSRVWRVAGRDFYAGNVPVASPTVLSAEQVQQLPVGATFTARLIYRFNSNYARPTSSTGSPTGVGESYYRGTFTVVAAST